jgi:hypothetical protein
MKVPMSIYELSSPVDYATAQVSHGQVSTNHGIINISPMQHDENYIKIAEDLKAYEDAYSACINHLSNNDFSDETVENCVGINYNYVYDDVDYEKSKLLARADSAIRDFMIQNCYTVAGVDLVLANACDLIENDVINLLWNELNYAALLDYHRNKYLFEHSFMNETIFNTLITEFQAIEKETSSLLTELYDHRTLTISHLEELISLRTSEILDSYRGKKARDLKGEKTANVISIDLIPSRSLELQTKDDGLKEVKSSNFSPVDRFLRQNDHNLKIRSNRIESAIQEKSDAAVPETKDASQDVPLDKKDSSEIKK